MAEMLRAIYWSLRMDNAFGVSKPNALSDDVLELLQWHADHAPDLTADIATLRAWQEEVGRRYSLPYVEVAAVVDHAVHGGTHPASVRIYSPAPAISDAAIFFVHGGSWMLGSVNSHDRLCRQICHATGLTVFSAEYGLAPENPFPHQSDDCALIYDWVRNNASNFSVNSDRLIVCGDSSGANLVAVLVHDLKHRGAALPLAQILIYPSVALCWHRSYPSWGDYGKGFLIGENSLVRTLKYYLRDEKNIEDPRASPILFSDFSGQPPALVLTADHDPIRDGGRSYASRLIDAGVNTRFIEFKGTIHGFLSFGLPQTAVQNAIDELKKFIHEMNIR